MFTSCRVGTHEFWDKPIGDWISAPSPNFVVMATRVGPNISGLSAIQADL